MSGAVSIPTGPAGVASQITPSFRMVRRYFIASVVSFVILSVLLAIYAGDIRGHHFQPRLLALTHVATLGWVTMIIFGAMYQLIPVVLEVKLFSERIAHIQFWLYLAGVIGVVYAFWTFNVGYLLAASAGLLTAAIFLFIINILVTMSRVTKWNLTGLFLLTALFYLGVTAVAGFLLAFNLGFPFISRIHLDYLKIHAHLGFIGWVAMVIMGVGLKLIPMFGLSHGFSTVPARVAFVLVNVGLLGTTIEWLLTGAEWLLQLYIAILVVGILCFIAQLALIFKKRLRRVLDLGMKHSAVAFGYFLLSTLTGAAIAFLEMPESDMGERIVLAYGILIMLGFFSMLIVGQMYKIVPFLVWYHTFSDRVGKEPVPMLAEMVKERTGFLQFWILNAGIPLSIAGVVAQTPALATLGFGLVALASVLFASNIAYVFRTKVRYDNSTAGSRPAQDSR